MTTRTTSLVVLLSSLLTLIVSNAGWATNHALLVGVSSYPSLRAELQLNGPKNDIVLMRGLLQQRGFPVGNIRVLADNVRDGNGDPTRARIMEELKALVDKARRGDYVFLFFAGHGSQQPARDLGPNNPEPDGLDEIFLPRDIGKWDGSTQGVHNAIVDDELGALITAIRNKGAFVWAVFDTCHSGTITRGVQDEGVRYRDAPPQDLGISQQQLLQAQKAGAALTGRTRGDSSAAPMTSLQRAKVGPGAGGFVAFYAAQSWQRAPEQPLPAHLNAGDPQKRPHGVLTYALSEVIAMNPNMSYRQAGEQILQRYRSQMRNDPTPLFEGDGASIDAALFGVKPGSQIMQWKIEKDENTLLVPAGLLHRLAEGATFSVVANPSDTEKAAIGYLRASRVESLKSTLVPMARDGKPLLDLAKLPVGAYARLLNPNTQLSLRVSLPSAAKSISKQATVAVLEKLSKTRVDGMAITWVPAREPGEVRLLTQNGHLWFLSSSGEIIASGEGKSPSIALNGKSDKELQEVIVDTLRKMARATNLIKLGAMAGSTPIAQGVELELRYERDGKPIKVGAGNIPVMRHGDQVFLNTRNKTNVPVDVNVLFVDSRYGIRQFSAERIVPNGKGSSEKIGNINANESIGRESLLVIVSEAQANRAQADFSFLQQPMLETTRGRGNEAPTLSDLLEAVGFEPERTRGMDPSVLLSNTAFRLFSWDTRR